jgi:hypothetical protein
MMDPAWPERIDGGHATESHCKRSKISTRESGVSKAFLAGDKNAWELRWTIDFSVSADGVAIS